MFTATPSLELGVGPSRPQNRNSSSVTLHRYLSNLFLKLFKKLFKLNHDSSCFITTNQSHCPSLPSLPGFQIPTGHSTPGTVLQMHPSMVPNIIEGIVSCRKLYFTHLSNIICIVLFYWLLSSLRFSNLLVLLLYSTLYLSPNSTVGFFFNHLSNFLIVKNIFMDMVVSLSSVFLLANV